LKFSFLIPIQNCGKLWKSEILNYLDKKLLFSTLTCKSLIDSILPRLWIFSYVYEILLGKKTYNFCLLLFFTGSKTIFKQAT